MAGVMALAEPVAVESRAQKMPEALEPDLKNWWSCQYNQRLSRVDLIYDSS